MAAVKAFVNATPRRSGSHPTSWAASGASSGILVANGYETSSGPIGRCRMILGKIKVAGQLYDAQKLTVGKIAKTIGVSRKTVYRHLADTQI